MSTSISIPTEPKALKKTSEATIQDQDHLHLIVPSMNRCASLPSAMHLAAAHHGGTRAVSQPIDDPKLTRHDSSSVKHLTCFWWKEKGACRFSDSECLYAHYDTGHYTDPPRQLVPGEPALAGRKLDKAMRNLATAHRSAGSLPSLAGSRHNSRSVTPVYDRVSPLTSPVSQISESDVTRLRNDNHFLKELVDQGMKEKSVMLNTIETMQAGMKEVKAEVDALQDAQKQLLVERADLLAKIRQLEGINFTTRTTNNPFGTTGRARVNTETRYLGGLLDNE